MLLTGLAVVAAGFAGWVIWDSYMTPPWTRDGRVRTYTLRVAPEVSGRITHLLVVNNQFVRKGEVVMQIETADYVTALAMNRAKAEQAKSDMDNKKIQADRRNQLTTLSTSVEEKGTYASQAAMSEASYKQALSDVVSATINLSRTRIVSPVNGWVTNLAVQVGDYASKGTLALSLVDADSFWVEGYFEETSLERISEGDPASIRLMGYRHVTLNGHVDSVTRGIAVSNAQPDSAGLSSPNPVFTWVRLAQRVPVIVRIDHVPEGVRLVAGMTATVQVEHKPR